MRKLNTADVFAAARVIRASGVRIELRELIARAAESDTPIKSVGIEGFLVVAEALAEKKAEQALYDFLSGPLEMPSAEIPLLPIDELMAKLLELTAKVNWKDFFKSVSGIAGKN